MLGCAGTGPHRGHAIYVPYYHSTLDRNVLVDSLAYNGCFGATRPGYGSTRADYWNSGQDGPYLAEFPISKGYQVHGAVRRVALEVHDDPVAHSAQPEGMGTGRGSFGSRRVAATEKTGARPR